MSPQHDYVIDNSTGANVRSDINSALQAIATNNSGSSGPSATFASQFFADTNAGIMKLRNTSNNGYVNLFTLAGGIDVDAVSNFNEDVTFTGASNNIVFDKSEDALKFADNAMAKFGASNDLQIHHDGSVTSFIAATTANLRISIAGGSNTLQLNKGLSPFEQMAQLTGDGAVELYFDNVPRLVTSSTGVTVVGVLSTTSHIKLPDNAQLQMGDAGTNDFILLHDGTDNIINCTNNGNLFQRASSIHLQSQTAENMAIGEANGAVELYFDNSPKFETTANGIKVSSSANSPEVGIFHATAGTYSSTTLQSVCSRNTSNESYNHFKCSVFGVGDRMFVRDNGDVENTNGTVAQISDVNLKENIVDASSQWNDIKNIRVRNFNFKEGVDPQKPTLIGVIAQEAEVVCPNLVKTSKSMQAGEEKDYKVFKYSILHMKAIKALQEAMAKIETLETKVAALEAA